MHTRHINRADNEEENINDVLEQAPPPPYQDPRHNIFPEWVITQNEVVVGGGALGGGCGVVVADKISTAAALSPTAASHLTNACIVAGGTSGALGTLACCYYFNTKLTAQRDQNRDGEAALARPQPRSLWRHIFGT